MQCTTWNNGPSASLWSSTWNQRGRMVFCYCRRNLRYRWSRAACDINTLGGQWLWGEWGCDSVRRSRGNWCCNSDKHYQGCSSSWWSSAQPVSRISLRRGIEYVGSSQWSGKLYCERAAECPLHSLRGSFIEPLLTWQWEKMCSHQGCSWTYIWVKQSYWSLSKTLSFVSTSPWSIKSRYSWSRASLSNTMDGSCWCNYEKLPCIMWGINSDGEWIV